MNAIIEKNAVDLLSGMPARFALKGPSGRNHDVHFCATCGTYVWSEYHVFPGDAWFVRVGTLDDPDLLKPDVHIFTRWKHVADILPDGVPCFDVYYDMKKQWPPESYNRLLSVMKTGARIPSETAH